jgi:hypothetical protein
MHNFSMKVLRIMTRLPGTQAHKACHSDHEGARMRMWQKAACTSIKPVACWWCHKFCKCSALYMAGVGGGGGGGTMHHSDGPAASSSCTGATGAPPVDLALLLRTGSLRGLSRQETPRPALTAQVVQVALAVTSWAT